MKNISRLLVESDYYLKNLVIGILKTMLFKKINEPKNIKNILIFRTGSIGDSVVALPAITNIRMHFTSARIAILTNEGITQPLNVSISSIIDSSLCDEIINYKNMSKAKLTEYIRSRQFEVFVDLNQNLAGLFNNVRNMIWAKSMGFAYGIGWNVGVTKFLRKFQEKNYPFKRESERLVNVLKDEGVPPLIFSYPLDISSTDKLLVDGMFSAITTTPIAFVVGAKRIQNRWPIDYFNKVGEALIAKGHQIVLVGGVEDSKIATPLLDMRSVHNFCGHLTPAQSAEVLRRCVLCVANDTGPMHLAYAVGTPLIAIFSSRDYPTSWFPPETSKNRVFRNNDIFCSICFSETCADNKCMKGIPPATIIKACIELLEREQLCAQ